MTSAQLTPEIKRILSENTNLQFDKTINKVRCSISGHEMPCSIDQIKLYLNGKKYKKLKDKQEDVFEKYNPHIVPNNKKGNEQKLFCVLTRSTINKSVKHVERHINGAAYKRALAAWEARSNLTTDTKTEDEPTILDEGSSSEEEDETEDDDMSDLYPDIDDGDEDDFDEDDDDDDSDDDLDQVEDIQDKKSDRPTLPSTSKRKSDFKDSQVKSKKHKKKPK